MKLTVGFLLTLSSALRLSGAQSQPESNPTECLSSDYDPAIDYFPIKVRPSEAAAFSIEYFNTYKIVTNLDSNTTYLLYQCGTEVPSTIDTSAFDAVLSIPIKSVGLSQTTQITYIEQLNKLGTVTFFLTDPEYNSSPCFQDRLSSGNIWLLRNGEPDASDLNDPTSSVVAPNGLVAFTSPFDSYLNTTATRILVSEYAETSNRAVFEWIHFYSAFFNAEALAESVVRTADDEYECIEENAQAVATDQEPPVVLWAYYSEFCSGWSIGKCPSYYCEFARDSGVKILQVADDFGAIVGQDFCAGENFLTTQQLVEVGQSASHWFFPAPYWNRTYPTFETQLKKMKSVQLEQVYDYQAAGENAWFQERLAEYYNVFNDFCSTVGSCPPYFGPNWFRNVFTEEIGDEGQCSDRENRFPFQIKTCSPDTTSSTSSSSKHWSPGATFPMAALATGLLAWLSH